MNGPLAGFDFVVELSHRVVLRLLQDTVRLNGVPLRAPFALTVQAPLGQQTLPLHLIVEDVRLDIAAAHLRLTLPFVRSSIEIGGFGAAVFPLSGTLQADVPMRISGNGDLLVVAFTEAAISLALSAEGQQTIAGAANNLGLDPPAAARSLADALRPLVQGVGLALLPTGFVAASGEDGDLRRTGGRRPSLSRLELFGIANPDRNRQSLALFGNLLAATEGQGNPRERTASAIAPGSDFLLAISARGFHAAVFCPVLAEQLRVARAQLPTDCGGADGLDYQGVTIKRVLATLNQDFIGVAVAVTGSAPCFDASGVVIAHVKLVVEVVAGGAGELRAQSTVAAKEFGVAVKWYCGLAITAAAGAWGGMALGWIIEIFESLATSQTDASVAGLLGTLVPDLRLPEIGIETVLQTAAVTANDVTLQWRARTVAASPATPALELKLQGSRVESSTSLVKLFLTRIFCQPEEKAYDYVVTRQSQRITYDVLAWLLPRPLSVAFSVRGRSGDWVPLDPQPHGLPAVPAVVPDVECRYLVPLATGGSTVVKSVSLRYRFERLTESERQAGVVARISLVNDAADGNFWLDLRAQVRDPAGQPPAGVKANPVTPVYLEGSVVEMGEAYKDDLAQCMQIAKDVSDRFKKSRDVPPWEQAIDRAGTLRAQQRALRALTPQEGQEMLRDFYNAFGGDLARLDAATQRAELAPAVAADGIDSGELESRLEAAIANLNATLAGLRRRR